MSIGKKMSLGDDKSVISLQSQVSGVAFGVDGREERVELTIWESRIARKLGERSQIDLTYEDAIRLEKALGKVLDLYERLWLDENEEGEEDGCTGIVKASGDVCEPA